MVTYCWVLLALLLFVDDDDDDDKDDDDDNDEQRNKPTHMKNRMVSCAISQNK